MSISPRVLWLSTLNAFSYLSSSQRSRPSPGPLRSPPPFQQSQPFPPTPACTFHTCALASLSLFPSLLIVLSLPSAVALVPFSTWFFFQFSPPSVSRPLTQFAPSHHCFCQTSPDPLPTSAQRLLQPATLRTRRYTPRILRHCRIPYTRMLTLFPVISGGLAHARLLSFGPLRRPLSMRDLRRHLCANAPLTVQPPLLPMCPLFRSQFTS